MKTDSGRFIGHGVAFAWDSEEAYQHMRAIEADLLADARLFREEDGVWIALTGRSLHDLALERLEAQGGPGPRRLGEGTNALTLDGGNAIWLGLTGGALTLFNAANANLGVGDSATAFANTQTDLQAAANKLRVVMDAGFPTILATVNRNQCQYRMSTGAAQFNWAEWALFNAAAAGLMFNRAVTALGNKTGVAATWQLLVTLTMQ